MAMSADWFTEVCERNGSSFSLKVKKKLHEEQTKYQKIEIFETAGFGNLMVIDGFIMLSQRDNYFYHEMMAHPVMFTHQNPESVLIIGGGDCGTLQAILQHPQVKSVRQIEIDEQVTRLSEKYFPELCSSNNDKRAEIDFIDGIKWVENAKDDALDIIVVDSTDPVGPAEGLFSKSFYEQCCRVLKDDGILIQQSESALYHMDILSDMYEAMSAAGFNNQSTLFYPQCVYPSGWWSATMAAKNVNLESFRQLDADNKMFDTQYYNAAIHQAALAKPEFFKRFLQAR